MKKSIILFISTILTFVIIDRLVSVVISNAEKNIITGNNIGKINYFLKVKDSIDIVVLGSSRALHHIDTGEFDRPAFNIGADGKKIGYSAGITSMLHKENQLLLVHIDHNRVFDLNYDGQDALGLLYKVNEDQKLKAFIKSNFSTDYYLSKGIHSYPYNGKVLVIIKNTLIKDSVNTSGFEPIFPTEVQKQVFLNMLSKEGLQMNINIHKPLEVSPVFERFVDIIKANANENKTQLVVFTSPSLNKVDGEVQRKVQTFFKKKGIIYFDHINEIENTDLSLWKDHTHLSAKGAAKYTNFLIEQLVENKVYFSKQ